MEKLCIRMDTTVRDAIMAIDNGKKKVVFIIDENRRLLGIFTDGDMRRFILHNGDMTQSIEEAMNPSAVTFASLEEATFFDI